MTCALALAACFSQGNGERDPVGGVAPGAAGSNLDPVEGSPQTPWLTPALDGEAELAPIRIEDAGRVPLLEPVTVTELAPLLPDTARLVGVALDSDGTHTYVLDARAGLYELTADGVRLVFDLPASHVVGSTGDGSPPAELTDVAFDPFHAGESGPSFALTAENDGFLLDLSAPPAFGGAPPLVSHFCYFPPVTEWDATPTPSLSQELREQGVAIVERTEAVAVSELTGQIFAQPRTLRITDGSVAGAELFVFDTVGGEPVGVRRLERSEFVAGGAAFLMQVALVLGSGNGLYVSLGWAEDVRRVATLGGVTEVAGIASRSGGNLIVLDGPSKRLLELDGSQVNDAIAAR